MPRRKLLIMLSQERRSLVWTLILLIAMAALGAGLAAISRVLSSRDYGIKVQGPTAQVASKGTMASEAGAPDTAGSAASEGAVKVRESGTSGTGATTGFSFDDSRIDRDRARAQRIDLLKDLIAQGGPGSSQAKDAEAEFTRLMDTMEKEMQIEELVRAKGYKDVIAFLGSDVCNVIVQTRGLTEEQAAQIGDIAVRVSGLPVTKISIVERQELARGW